MVKGVAKLERIMFSKGDFVIGLFKPVEVTEGEMDTSKEFSMKGNMSHVKKGTEYTFMAQETFHEKYGLGYDVAFIRENVTLDKKDKKSIRNFLEVILTERQIKSIYSVTDDPIKAMEEGDVELLTTANGIGETTAKRIIKHYNNQKDYTVAYMELGGELGLTANSIKKVVEYYGSPDLAVEKIKDNAYALMDIDGYGFKKCDEIFLGLGGSEDATKRIEAFLKHVLDTRANEGHTWTSPQDVLKEAFEFIPTADKALIGRLMINHPDFVINEERTKISFKNFIAMEALIAFHLNQLVTADVKFDNEGWEDIVEKAEKVQGWQYTDQQIEAMKLMFDNNVVMIEGLAGTGKSTSLKTVLEVLESKGYQYVQSALSGQASSNLTLVTGREGYTIHRLLGFNPEKMGFMYNSSNPLPANIIIVDEFSMVDAKLFMHLVSAIRKGSKLILLGDSGQLPSIGIPVMRPIIESGVIPHIILDKIHRQAEKSAIATHSIEVRYGNNTAPTKTGKTTAGELQDLDYIMVDSDDDILREVAISFKQALDDGLGVKDIQILSATRNKGFTSCDKINSICQKIYNPKNDMLNEVQVGGEKGYIIREGDKVINVKNNYSAETVHGEESPVFNGNIGIVESIMTEEDEDGKQSSRMIIDFEGIGRLVFKDTSFHCIELAYAVTVHKSQGMGIERVIIALPYHFMLNSRQLLYTAMTRAKKNCILVTTSRTMKATVKKNVVDERRTYLSEMLKHLNNHSVSSYQKLSKEFC